MSMVKILLWRANNIILGIPQNPVMNVSSQAEMATLQSHFWLLHFAHFHRKKTKMFQMLFLYTWFVKTSGSDSNEGKKKNPFCF